MIKKILLSVLFTMLLVGGVHADPTIRKITQEVCGRPLKVDSDEGVFLYPFHSISLVKGFRGKLTDTEHLTVRSGDGIQMTFLVPSTIHIGELLDRLC